MENKKVYSSGIAFYDDIKYKIDIQITGEQIDIAGISQTIDTMIMMLGQNPGVLDDPRIRKMLYKRIDLLGLNPKDWFDEEVKSLPDEARMSRVQRGGSIASPTPISSPAMVPAEATL